MNFWDTVKGNDLADQIIYYLPKIFESLEKLNKNLENREKEEN